jgi:uncharacterized protein
MLRVLNDQEIHQVLERGIIGRIGFTNRKKVFVLPVIYFYDGKYIIAHSREGTSIQVMRENPEVCFEVDEMQKLSQWNSITLWGRYEELTGNSRERYYAYDRLIRKINKLKVKEMMTITHAVSEEEDSLQEQKVNYVVYRIRIEKISGRQEIQ